MNETVIKYRAHPTCVCFHQSSAPLRVLVGPTKSGTTLASLVEIISRACEQQPDPDQVRRSRWAVVAESIPKLKADHIPTWQSLNPGTSTNDGSIHRLRFRLPDQTQVECEVYFLPASDTATLASLKLTGAVISGDVEEIVLSTLRSSVGLFPNYPTYTGLVVEGLFPAPDDWLQRLISSEPSGLSLFAQPAADSDDAENVDNLPSGYYTRLVTDNPVDWATRHIRPGQSHLVTSIVVNRIDYDRNVTSTLNINTLNDDNPGEWIETELGKQLREEEERQRRSIHKPAKPEPPPPVEPAKPVKTLDQLKPPTTGHPISATQAGRPSFKDIGQYIRGRKPKSINT